MSVKTTVLAAALFMVALPAEAQRYRVFCAAPNGPWCRIACRSDRAVACYANVVSNRCVKTCRYY